MGMKYPFGKNIDSITELKKLGDREAKKVKMEILDKDATWLNGSKSRYKPADLDHVVASDNITFKKFSNASVKVMGWPKEKNVPEKDRWIKKYSDHGIIYFEVHK